MSSNTISSLRTQKAIEELNKDYKAMTELQAVFGYYIIGVSTEEDFLIAFNKYRCIKSEHLND